MRTQLNGLTLCVGISLLLAGSAFSTRVHAQATSAQDPPPPAEALPPPSMDDPGLVAPPPPEDKQAPSAKKKAAAAPPALPAQSAPVKLIPLASGSLQPAAGELTSTDPTPPKPSLTHSAANSPAPADSRLSGDGITVSVRTMDNGDRIEEYRSGGQLTRVKVTPRKAPPYEIIDTNGDGHVDSHDKNSQKTVGWTLFKWH